MDQSLPEWSTAAGCVQWMSISIGQSDLWSSTRVYIGILAVPGVHQALCRWLCNLSSSLKHCWLHPPTHTYRMNVTLEWVDSFKYPGVRIDSKLKWGARYRLTATFKFMCKVLRDLARQFSFVWNAMALHLLSGKSRPYQGSFQITHSKMKANIRYECTH